jgi:hypothetical protein
MTGGRGRGKRKKGHFIDESKGEEYLVGGRILNVFVSACVCVKLRVRCVFVLLVCQKIGRASKIRLVRQYTGTTLGS